MSELCKKPINMKSLPLVSMVIPSYNHALYIQQCIASVIAQDYKNIELIIIDDGSTDDSVRLICEMEAECHERFTRFEFRARANKGLSATLNEALEWADGTFFSAIASDDSLFPAKTSLLLTGIEDESDVAGVFGGCECIDSNGINIDELKYSQVYFNFEDIIKHRHSIQACTQLLRLKNVRESGGYLAGVYIEDWYMWLKLTEAGYKLKVVPDVVAYYRYHDSNSSSNRLKMFEARKQVLSYFKYHASYANSVAEMCVWAAIDFSCISKKQSIGYLCQAVFASPGILATRYFIKGLLIWLTPCYLIGNASRFKARWPRLFGYLPTKVW